MSEEKEKEKHRFGLKDYIALAIAMLTTVLLPLIVVVLLLIVVVIIFSGHIF